MMGTSYALDSLAIRLLETFSTFEDEYNAQGVLHFLEALDVARPVLRPLYLPKTNPLSNRCGEIVCRRKEAQEEEKKLS